MADANTFEMGPSVAQYEKKPIPDILKESEDVDVQASSKEILTWIANNVEQFIDNQKRMFKLDLIIDVEDGAEETMPATRQLQDLYRAIPNDPVSDIEGELTEDNYNKIIEQLPPEDRELMDSIQACRSHLDSVSTQVFEAMREDEDLLASLFKRMGFYYELQGINEGQLLLEELNGEVDIVKFEYEAFPVSVQVTAPTIERMNEDGTITEEGGEVANEYIIPEGFTIWLEIAFKSKQKELTSLF
jgi:hypothetical protein